MPTSLLVESLPARQNRAGVLWIDPKCSVVVGNSGIKVATKKESVSPFHVRRWIQRVEIDGPVVISYRFAMKTQTPIGLGSVGEGRNGPRVDSKCCRVVLDRAQNGTTFRISVTSCDVSR